MKDFLIYFLILVASTYLIRTLPFALFKKPIENRFLKSFLFYIPFAVLAAMTVPAVFTVTGHIASSLVGLAVGLIFALQGKGLTAVALLASLGALLTEGILLLL